MSWNEHYKTEKELIDDMMKTKSDTNKYPPYQIVKGYQYIESFKKYYIEHGNLTDKQIVQMKRMANEIYKNVNWDCYK